jgi:hypothetical protein
MVTSKQFIHHMSPTLVKCALDVENVERNRREEKYPEDVNRKTMEDRTNHGDCKRVMEKRYRFGGINFLLLSSEYFYQGSISN